MTETTQKTYQWLKGDKIGKFVKWDGEILNDGGMNFLIFTDGTRGNEELLGDYFIEVANESEGFIDTEMMKPEPTYQQTTLISNQPKQKIVITEPEITVSENPISRLLSDSKKSVNKISLNLELNMPSVELMKVLSDSYEDGEKHVLEFLSVTIKDIRLEVATQIWKEINNKQKEKDNGTA